MHCYIIEEQIVSGTILIGFWIYKSRVRRAQCRRKVKYLWYISKPVLHKNTRLSCRWGRRAGGSCCTCFPPRSPSDPVIFNSRTFWIRMHVVLEFDKLWLLWQDKITENQCAVQGQRIRLRTHESISLRLARGIANKFDTRRCETVHVGDQVIKITVPDDFLLVLRFLKKYENSMKFCFSIIWSIRTIEDFSSKNSQNVLKIELKIVP